jgi:NADH dehydrogenase [ubiquinone] 1 alpha subcomplex assembly factor 5
MRIFDRTLKALHRDRAFSCPDNPALATYFQGLGTNALANRLQTVVGKEFNRVGFIGPYPHVFLKENQSQFNFKEAFLADLSPKSLNWSAAQVKLSCPTLRVTKAVLDEEDWSFPEDSFNLVVHNMQLHWVNEVASMFERIHKSLTPDGALLGVGLGGDSLQEVRIALTLAEQEREGGVSQHVSPMMYVQDVGNILNRQNYKLITITADKVTVYVQDLFQIMEFLQDIGEANALVSRRPRVSPSTFEAANAIFCSLFVERSGEFEGLMPVTFELIHYIAWKEHESQQQPLRPGTKGVDIRTLANEVSDEELEVGEIYEQDEGVEVKYTTKR